LKSYAKHYVLKATRTYDNLPKKKGGHFTFEDKWPVFFESYEKRDGGECHAEKNIALSAACLITPSDFMIPGTICKDVSA